MGGASRSTTGSLLALLLVALAAAVGSGCGEDTIADDVRVGAVDVGGKKSDEARALIERRLAGTTDQPVAVLFGQKHFVLRPEVAKARIDPGATVDAALDADGGDSVAPRVTFDRAAVTAFARRIADRVDRRPRDADIDWHDGKLERTRARAGLKVDQPELVQRVARVLGSPAPQRRVQVPVQITKRPDRTFEDLAKRYPTVIAVDRDAKLLRLYKHLQLEHKYKIAVGKAGLETAAGRYKIVEKIVNPDWHVPNSSWAGELAGQTIPAGDPRNPLEARWMGFHEGQGIHGTTDIDSLGTAASHGCIRMSIKDVKQLYSVVKIGTPLFLQ
jgi:lipoprotein-anchoring transpeptidase ErfK/SrfK